jgi:hypothetical protein
MLSTSYARKMERLVATACNLEQLEFHALSRREVIGRFDGGRITSDGDGGRAIIATDPAPLLDHHPHSCPSKIPDSTEDPVA